MTSKRPETRQWIAVVWYDSQIFEQIGQMGRSLSSRGYCSSNFAQNSFFHEGVFRGADKSSKISYTFGRNPIDLSENP